MTLAPGMKLGPYEILAPLGAGGMGEVYRARDPKLDRLVAIKVLPGHLAQDADAEIILVLVVGILQVVHSCVFLNLVAVRDEKYFHAL